MQCALNAQMCAHLLYIIDAFALCWLNRKMCASSLSYLRFFHSVNVLCASCQRKRRNFIYCIAIIPSFWWYNFQSTFQSVYAQVFRWPKIDVQNILQSIEHRNAFPNVNIRSLSTHMKVFTRKRAASERKKNKTRANMDAMVCCGLDTVCYIKPLSLALYWIHWRELPNFWSILIYRYVNDMQQRTRITL